MKSIKKIVSVILILTLTFSLIACSQKDDATDKTSGEGSNKNVVDVESAEDDLDEEPEPIEISIGFWPADDDEAKLKLYEGYKAEFEADYPHVTIVPAHYRYNVDTFLPMALSGEVPTVFSTFFTEPQKMIEGNFVADITDYVQELEYDSKLNPAFLDLATKDERIYGLPYAGYGLGLMINVKLFEEAGLVDKDGMPLYPKTFEEVKNTARIITEKTGKAGIFVPTSKNTGGWHFTNTAWNFGVNFMEVVDGEYKSNINSPEMIEALQYIRDLKYVEKTLLPDAILAWPEWVQNFGTDNVAMVYAPSMSVNEPVRQYEMDRSNIAFAPIPEGPGGQYSLSGGDLYMFSVDASPEQIRMGLKFLEYTGYTPNVTDEAIEDWEDKYASDDENGYAVGVGQINPWINEERIKAEEEIIDQYRNVRKEYFDLYYDKTEGLLRAEPFLAQELYSSLDVLIQMVLADENADIPSLAAQADELFKTEYLDNLD